MNGTALGVVVAAFFSFGLAYTIDKPASLNADWANKEQQLERFYAQ
jgi:hypothetical protein